MKVFECPDTDEPCINEYRILHGLDHPGVVKVHDLFKEPKMHRCLTVMEHV